MIQSGATPWWKEDMISEKYLIQHKDAGKTHTLKHMDLITLHRNAIDEDREPIYIVDFENRRIPRWYVIPDYLFEELDDRDKETKG